MDSQNNFSIFPISSLFIAIGFLAIGYGMIITFVGVHLKESGSSDIAIGLINAAFFLGGMLASTLSQKIISTIGHIRSFSTFASMMIITFLAQSLIFNEFFWGLMRFISGFSYYALLIILESWLNEKSPRNHRGKILAIYSIIFYLAIAIGQLSLNIGAQDDATLFIVGSILVLCSILFISMTKVKEPSLKPFDRYSLPKIFSIAPLALVGSFIGGLFVGGFFTMLPIYVLDRFASIESVSLFMTATILGAMISQWPIGILSDRFGRRLLLAGSGFFIALLACGFLFLPLERPLFYLFGALLGMGVFSLYPLSLARANDVVDENTDIIEISRTLLFTYGLGSFSAPLILSFGYSFFDDFIFSTFLFFGIVLGIYALSRERVHADDMSVFVNMPSVSSAEVQNLDPRR